MTKMSVDKKRPSRWIGKPFVAINASSIGCWFSYLPRELVRVYALSTTTDTLWYQTGHWNRLNWLLHCGQIRFSPSVNWWNLLAGNKSGKIFIKITMETNFCLVGKHFMVASRIVVNCFLKQNYRRNRPSISIWKLWVTRDPNPLIGYFVSWHINRRKIYGMN